MTHRGGFKMAGCVWWSNREMACQMSWRITLCFRSTLCNTQLHAQLHKSRRTFACSLRHVRSRRTFIGPDIDSCGTLHSRYLIRLALRGTCVNPYLWPCCFYRYGCTKIFPYDLIVKQGCWCYTIKKYCGIVWWYAARVSRSGIRIEYRIELKFMLSAAQATQSLDWKYCLNSEKSWQSCLTKVLMIPLLPAEVSYSDSRLASGQFINRSGHWTLPAKTKL